MQRAKSVEEYLEIHPEWKEELEYLREIIHKTEANECIKWGAPTYTINNKNVFGLGAFKSYVGIWFFQGALLEDKHKLLINAQEGKTQAMRQMRFSSLEDIDAKSILFYLEEAIQNQKEGRTISPQKKTDFEMPAELKEALDKNELARSKFEALTNYKKKEYAAHIADAKRESTKLNRLNKIIPMIESGLGLNDKYRNC